MSNLVSHIQNMFATSSLAEAESIAEKFELVTIEKNTQLLKEGEVNRRMYFLATGYLRMYALHEYKEITQWIFTPNYFVVDLASFFLHKPARFTIQALTPCTAYAISKEQYASLADSFPVWQTLERNFLLHCFISLEQRMFQHLSLTAEERYQQFFAQHAQLFNQLPLQYLASLLGMTPETLSRIRKKAAE